MLKSRLTVRILLGFLLCFLAVNNYFCFHGFGVDPTPPLINTSRLQIVIVIGKHIGLDNISKNVIEAVVYDSSYQQVSLDRGRIEIQNEELRARSLEANQVRYELQQYSRLGFFLDSLYQARIYVGADKYIHGSVRTHDKDLLMVNTPGIQSKAKDLQIEWKEIDARYPMQLRMTYYYRDNTQTLAGIREFSITDPGSGKFTIPSAVLKNPNSIYKINLYVWSEKKGSLESGFASGSKIYSQLSHEKQIDIVN